MILCRFGSTAVLLSISGILFAADPVHTAAGKLESIKKDFEDARAAYYKAIKDLPKTPKSEKTSGELWKAFDKKQTEGFAAAVELAKADPKSEDAFAALEWVLMIPRAYYVPAGRQAIGELTEHHAANPKIGKIVVLIGRLGPREDDLAGSSLTALLFKAVLEKNPDRTARGQVALSLAWQAARLFAVAEYKRSPETDALAGRAETAFEAVVKDYADCPLLMKESQQTLGEVARRELYGLRNLRVGKVAPEIEGEDLDGAKFKLTDSRGKVTMLVFWATWCGPCMRQVPHERELVARTKGKPFALVGVDGDDDRAKGKQVTIKEQMTWQSFWNGPGGSSGAIARAWNLQGWPTVYLLDAKGIIRFKDLPPKQLDEAVDLLLKELEDGKKTKS